MPARKTAECPQNAFRRFSAIFPSPFIFFSLLPIGLLYGKNLGKNWKRTTERALALPLKNQEGKNEKNADEQKRKILQVGITLWVHPLPTISPSSQFLTRLPFRYIHLQLVTFWMVIYLLYNKSYRALKPYPNMEYRHYFGSLLYWKGCKLGSFFFPFSSFIFCPWISYFAFLFSCCLSPYFFLFHLFPFFSFYFLLFYLLLYSFYFCTHYFYALLLFL